MKGSRLLFSCIFFLCFVVTVSAATIRQHPERVGFYGALRSNDISRIDDEISALQNKAGMDPAFEAALVIKKSGLLKDPKQKLDLFKKGKIKLEESLAASPSYTELHFIRLVVQEQSPKMLGYKSELRKDADFVNEHFRELPKDLQQQIREYCSISNYLKVESGK
jgi:hypothetical protein